MGLFDGIFGEHRKAAPSLKAVLVTLPADDDPDRIRAEKELANESDGILSALTHSGESCLAVAHGMSDESVIVVITDQRTFTIKRGRIRQAIHHHDVADVMLGRFINRGVLVRIEPRISSSSRRDDTVIQFRVATPMIGSVIRSHIRRQEQGASEHTLPRDIVALMERFGHLQFDLGSRETDVEDIFLRLADLVYPFAQADPVGFISALAQAVMPVGGWAVYGASRTVWEFLSPDRQSPLRRDPSYRAIMDASLTFLRTIPGSEGHLSNYELEYWWDNGGKRETW